MPTYSIVELRPPNNEGSSSAYGVNKHGDVVGSVTFPFQRLIDNNFHAVLMKWGQSTSSVVEPPGSSGGIAWDINDNRWLVGGYFPPEGHPFSFRAFARHSDGALVDIHSFLEATYSNAAAINNKDVAAGNLVGEDGPRVFRFDIGSNTATILDHTDIEPVHVFNVRDINDDGTIVGTFIRDDKVFAFTSEGDSLVPLFDQTATAVAINNDGTIVGSLTENSPQLQKKYYKRNPDGTLEPPIIGFSSFEPYDIDAAGNTVGKFMEGAWSIQNNVPLPILAPGQFNWTLLKACAMSEMDQLVGTGERDGKTRGWLLTTNTNNVPPVDPPDPTGTARFILPGKDYAETWLFLLGSIDVDGGGIAIDPKGGIPMPPWDPILRPAVADHSPTARIKMKDRAATAKSSDRVKRTKRTA